MAGAPCSPVSRSPATTDSTDHTLMAVLLNQYQYFACIRVAPLLECPLTPNVSPPLKPPLNRRPPQLAVKKWLLSKPRKPRMKLSEFSTWLSDFDSHLHRLEVPGQYGGLSAGPPRVSQHTRIVRYSREFSPRDI